MRQDRERQIEKTTTLEPDESSALEDAGVTVVESKIGFVNKVVQLELDGEPCFGKFYKRRECFENERLWLVKLDGLDFLPRVMHSNEEPTNPLLIISKVPGVFLRDLPSEYALDRGKLIKSLVEKIHAIDTKIADMEKNIDDWIASREKLIQLWSSVLVEPGILPDGQKEIVEEAVKQFRAGYDLIGRTARPTFVHSDLNARNITINPESQEVEGIIDFEYATIGDRIYDAIRIMWRIVGNQDEAVHLLREAGFAEFNEDEMERLRLYRIFNYIGSLYFSISRKNHDVPYDLLTSELMGGLSEAIIQNG